MQGADESFHGTFLRTMFMGIRLGASAEKMSCGERKRAIKLSANVAMAAASRGMSWSRALIARHAADERGRALVRSLLGRKGCESVTRPCLMPKSSSAQRRTMMRGRVRRSPALRRRASTHSAARVIATSLVKKRTRILKRLVPGGESMDDLSLLGETIDYVISLQAQVNLMRLVTEALGVPNLSPPTQGAIVP